VVKKKKGRDKNVCVWCECNKEVEEEKEEEEGEEEEEGDRTERK
jgi:hypothetical protein